MAMRLIIKIMCYYRYHIRVFFKDAITVAIKPSGP
jgi:hypothetical protein